MSRRRFDQSETSQGSWKHWDIVRSTGRGNDIRRELTYLADCDADVIFNLCESINGQSGLQPCFAGYLELLGIPFTGSDSAGITIAIDKRQTKAILQSRGINTPQAWLAASLLPLLDPAQEQALSGRVRLPVIVKPARETEASASPAAGGHDLNELRSAVQEAANASSRKRPCRALHRRPEFTSRAIPTAKPARIGDHFRVLPPNLTDHVLHAKWDPDSPERRSFRRLCPAPLTPEEQVRVVETVKRHTKPSASAGYGRIDVRLETTTGEFFVLDVTANPDITDGQDFLSRQP